MRIPDSRHGEKVVPVRGRAEFLGFSETLIAKPCEFLTGGMGEKVVPVCGRAEFLGFSETHTARPCAFPIGGMGKKSSQYAAVWNS